MTALVDALRAAALPFIPPERADELARNLAQCDAEDLRYLAVLEAVEHRRRHFALEVENPDALASALWRAGVRALSAELRR